MQITIETEDRSHFYTTETLRGKAWCHNCNNFMASGTRCFLDAAAQKGYCSLKCIEEHHEKPKKILEGVEMPTNKALEIVIDALENTTVGLPKGTWLVTKSLKKDTAAWRILLKLLEDIRDGALVLKHTNRYDQKREKAVSTQESAKASEMRENKGAEEVFFSAYPAEAINKEEMEELLKNLRKWYGGLGGQFHKDNMDKLFRLTANLWSSFFGVSTEAEVQRKRLTELEEECEKRKYGEPRLLEMLKGQHRTLSESKTISHARERIDELENSLTPFISNIDALTKLAKLARGLCDLAREYKYLEEKAEKKVEKFEEEHQVLKSDWNGREMVLMTKLGKSWDACGKLEDKVKELEALVHITISPNITLMTHNEVVTRLAAGEDSIELSIEKWERIVNYLKQEPSDLSELRKTAGGGSCALCQESARSFGKTDCWNCPYFLYYGESCVGEYPTFESGEDLGMLFDYPPHLLGPWAHFDRLLRFFKDSTQHNVTNHALIKSAEVMRDKLIELRVMK